MLSIIIVTYNAAATLQRCLDSVYAQEFPHIDLIVIDGLSTDGTMEILQKNASRLKFLKSEADEGIYDAMNKALPQISTPWVYFLGADDLLLPEFSNFITELKNPNTIYYGNVIYKGRKCSGKVSPYRQAKSGIFHQSVIYPSSIFKKYTFNTKYKVAADYHLNMQLHKNPDYTFEFKDYTISSYNDTGISATQKDIAFEKDKSRLVFENFGFSIWLRYTFRLFKAALKKEKNE